MAPLKSRAPPTSDTRSAAYLLKSRPRCPEVALLGLITRASLAGPNTATASARLRARNAACFSQRVVAAATEVRRVGDAIVRQPRQRRRIGRSFRTSSPIGTHDNLADVSSFDDLVGTQQDGGRDRNAECPRRPEVEYHLILGGLFDG